MFSAKSSASVAHCTSVPDLIWFDRQDRHVSKHCIHGTHMESHKCGHMMTASSATWQAGVTSHEVICYAKTSKFSFTLISISCCLQILHRDIKSGNVLLSEDFSSAKVCDVGLAHIMGSTSLSSTSSNVQTTLAYAAPEMLLCLRSTFTLISCDSSVHAYQRLILLLALGHCEPCSHCCILPVVYAGTRGSRENVGLPPPV